MSRARYHTQALLFELVSPNDGVLFTSSPLPEHRTLGLPPELVFPKSGVLFSHHPWPERGANYRMQALLVESSLSGVRSRRQPLSH